MRRSSFSIQQQLIVLIVSSMLVVLSFLAIYQSSQQIGAMTSGLRRRATTYGAVMAQQVTSAVAFSDKETAREVLRSIDADTDVTSVALYNEDGAVLYTSGAPSITGSRAVRSTQVALTDEGSRIVVVSPVLSVEGPRGALVIELSTASLREARTRIVWLALLTGAAALTCGIGFAWYIARRLARRLSAIANVATAVAQGDLTQEPIVDRQRDEIGALAAAFNAMLGQIKQHHDRLERLVSDRTAQLEQRTAEMQLVFDHVDQGLLIAELDGTLARQRSAAVERWLGDVPASGKLHDFVRTFAPEAAAWFAVQWDALREDMMPIEVCLAQLPSRFEVAGREIELSYQPLSDGGKLRILIVVTDVTARSLQRGAERDERETSSLVSRLLRGRVAFLAFHAEATRYTDIIASAAIEDTTFRRAVHTLKGICSLECLDSIADQCHTLETAIAEGESAVASATCRAIVARWTLVTSKLRPLMEVAATGVDVAVSDLVCFEKAATRGTSRGELVEIVESWRDERVAARFAGFAEDAVILAERLGKAPLRVAIEVDDGLRLPCKQWGPFWSVFVHAIRNAVDHGVEPAAQRTQSAADQLVLRARRIDNRITVEIEDFGAGIDWAAVEIVARARGLAIATASDLETALFTDGVSTRDAVTDTSGRGVGMAALREACESSGGRISVASQRGRGTKFTFTWRVAQPAHQLAG
jgi:HAMP domain-containing protein